MSRGAEGGRVHLVGAGPGDPDLITVRGARLLAKADVVLYDELTAPELLELAPEGAERINVGKRGHEPPSTPQDEINRLLVERAQRGLCVVRLKGGDPFVFGRGGEEASACVEAGVPFEVVPGVSSALAAPAYAGIPVTDRRSSASFAVVTGHKDPSKAARATRWQALATAVDTVVILMGMRNLPELAKQMIQGGLDPGRPSAAVMRGTHPDQRVVEAPLSELANRVAEAGLGAPSVIVVGDVVSLRETLRWREQTPLFGVSVLVTRPREQAGEMLEAIRDAGGQPVAIPLIEIAPPPDDGSARAERAEALARLDDYDAIVFASTNAVRGFVRWVEEEGREDGGAAGGPSCDERLASLRARALCMGPKTARAAREAGLVVGHTVRGGTAEALLEVILAAGPVAGRRFLLPRSDVGRNVLRDGLREAGATVDAIQVYRTRPADFDAAALNRQLAEGALQVLTFTSPSAVRSFAAGLDEVARAALSHCLVAAIGATTAEALREAGIGPDVQAATSDARGLIDAVAHHVAGGRLGPRDATS